MRILFLSFFVVALAGCGGGGSADPTGESTAAQTTAPPTDETQHAGAHTGEAVPDNAHPVAPANGTAPQNAPSVAQNVAPAANGETRIDAQGIIVTRKPDGTITVQGTDRWGAHLDITYADAHYYKHAVDVLGLSLTPEQERALQDSLPTIAPEALHDRAPPQPAGVAAGR